MDNRLKLQSMLEEILGSKNVYYQPPSSIKMEYPAIVYSRSNINNYFANDSVYVQSHYYDVIVIDYDPDSDIVDKISRLLNCKFNRHYTVDNLNHDLFIIYF